MAGHEIGRKALPISINCTRRCPNHEFYLLFCDVDVQIIKDGAFLCSNGIVILGCLKFNKERMGRLYRSLIRLGLRVGMYLSFLVRRYEHVKTIDDKGKDEIGVSRAPTCLFRITAGNALPE